MSQTIPASKPATFDLFKRNRPFLTQEHEMFRTSLRKFLEKEAVPNIEKWEEEQFTPREFYQKMGEQGFLCPQVAPEYGGLGLDFGFNMVLAEELSRVGVGGLASMSSSIIVPYLERYGTEEQKKKYLPKCVSGEITTAIGMTEPGIGSDLAGMRTTAVRDGDYYIINGQKTFISNGFNAGLFFICVKTDPTATPAHKGISILLVEDGTPGFSRGRKLKKLGQHSTDTAELIFEEARVPVSNLLGEECKGFYYLMDKLQQERIMIAIGALAVAEEMLKSTMAYVKERHAFGKPISSFQNTQFEIAEMATEVTMAQTFLDDLTNRHMKGENVTTQVSMAKWSITEMARRMSARCLQLHGGYGFMEEYSIARRYRDVAVMPIYGGTTEIMKNIIAKNLGM
ncbi:acyl-CoA dehydrogenase family protein [Brevibacillus sp. AG]|uniref:acyl-CoA dehydrogenase family protein n=1 Tax=Brevibacillus sp. AG TaxID=3020891 RepID=UPI000852A330|nr:acyl-CoA dehydrogenase family protein [Brevibacillus sp. AG]MDC0759534.1 acyl-CoA dehydrogenase family protein [Brevibacillus sp. AG]